MTGCSEGGIGDALAQEFHRRGYLVFATARSLKKIQHLENLGINIFELDVTSKSSIEAAVAHIGSETNDVLDVLVNNSGSGKNFHGLEKNLLKMQDITVHCWMLI